jgi:hypothetical protein
MPNTYAANCPCCAPLHYQHRQASPKPRRSERQGVCDSELAFCAPRIDYFVELADIPSYLFWSACLFSGCHATLGPLGVSDCAQVPSRQWLMPCLQMKRRRHLAMTMRKVKAIEAVTEHVERVQRVRSNAHRGLGLERRMLVKGRLQNRSVADRAHSHEANWICLCRCHRLGKECLPQSPPPPKRKRQKTK